MTSFHGLTNAEKNTAALIREEIDGSAPIMATVAQVRGRQVRVRLPEDQVAGETWFTSVITPVPIGSVGLVVPMRGNARYFLPLGVDLGDGGGSVNSVNGKTGTVILNADDIDDTTTSHRFVTVSDLTKLSNLSGVNTGDQDLSGLATKSELASKADGSTLLSALPLDIGGNGQILKVQSGGVSWQPDLNTTYSELTEAEIDAGTANTLRTISGRRVQSIVNKAREGLALASSLSLVATSGSYNDLSGKPTLGTAAAMNANDFATAAQGAKADAALQSTPLLEALPSSVGLNGFVLKAIGGSVAWQSDVNTTYAEISDAEITAGTSTSMRTISGRRAQSIVNKAREGLALASSLSLVATSGNYTDLSNRPTLGTAAAMNAGDFATATQGAKADAALQPTPLLTALPSSIGSSGQVLRVQSGSVVWQNELNTTYNEISDAEITAGTSATPRTISGRRAQSIVNKALGQLGDLAMMDKVGISDIDAAGTPSGTTFLGGDGQWKGVPVAGNPDWNDITGKPTAFPTVWNIVSDKPATFPPEPHNHDDRYYTEAEVESLISEWRTRSASIASNTVNSTSHVSTEQSTFPILYAFPVSGIFSDISEGVWDVAVTFHALVYRSVATGGVYISAYDRDAGGGTVSLGRNFPQTGGYTLTVSRVFRNLTPSSIIDLKYSGFSTAGTTYCVSHDATFTATRVG